MSYLYKRSNWLWHKLIQHRLTARVWRPLVGLTHKRHLAFRKRLALRSVAGEPGCVVSAGV